MINEEMRSKFSTNMKFYMRQRNATQQDVADALGVTQQTVSAWCGGGKLPRMDKLNALAEYLGTTGDVLLKGDSVSNLNDLVVRDLRQAGYFDLSVDDRDAVIRLIRQLSRR